MSPVDKVGIGWRRELAQKIGESLDSDHSIGFLEVIAEDYFDAPEGQIKGLAQLAKLVPLSIHGVSLGLASCSPIQKTIAEKIARLCEAVQPVFWSEHMSFVRAGGHEIGHLAAPPRCDETIEGAILNCERLRSIVGTAPILENIATIVDPPGSTMAEEEWISRILKGAETDLLLDLHNLHANATNFGYCPFEFIRRLPLERIRQIHLSGGVEVNVSPGVTRILDDHIHDVPHECYALLEEVAAHATQALYVIVERDGKYPPWKIIVDQLARARSALVTGRERQIKGA